MKRVKPVIRKPKPVIEPIAPRKRIRSSDNFPFDDMQPGESFYYDGPRNTAIISFVYRLASGFYRTEKEGDGWRFHLLKKLPKE